VEALLEREAGLHVPVLALADWARGLSHDPDRAEVALDQAGRAELIRESGWQIRLRDYDDSVVPARPRALEAERPPYRVRLAIASWQLGS
jgi:outer membrane lipoprotein LolB